ncbi:RecB-like exonuclease/helicase [Mycobacterium phage Nairb]|uniref:RecB-like exonuclease/helicase n=5 Tax=Bernalvirus bernal13 TaxID=1982102 RepID=A0A2P1JRS5_9CAUD|nr:exonuclease VIII [Mycobacterium phage Bernal13]AIT13457.1 RecB-like exonuclease/helicase [Mycobacterium phage RonRayGun]ASJ79124.1 RecB-like exonuclease/helicase [Mycobacterium phage ZenTime222]AVO21831.1 RecB-like exonuclease/helicase [Mycobacterium phage Nairb]QBP28889.1 RecB-like exonuclease/helicase [Mycobacterium phage Ibrahim]QHB47448.1 RecB-like exonuclease/helicase [Mycobacterium phage Whitty]
MIPVEDGVYTDISDVEYHADKTSLSSSGARTLINATPAKFLEERNTPPNPKPEYDAGHGAHFYVLGKGSDIVVVDAPNWQTKDARQARIDAWAAGKVPLLTKQDQAARAMAEKVHAHPTAGALFAVGDAEVSGYWRDSATNVRLRWRADWLHPGRSRLIIVDYKTTKNAHPNAFPKSVADYGYHQQDAWYRDGVIANGVDDDPLFLFVAQDKTPPYELTIHELRPADVERGRRLNRKAIDLYAKCESANEWPSYDPGIHTVNFPSYAQYREESELS